MPSYLLRVELEDRPGSLGSLAVALGSVGADILSLDVVERAAGYAVDDLVVELPPGAMPDMLITAAEKLNGVYVDSIRPHTGLLEAHRELELIDHIAAARGKQDKLQVLADEAPKVLRVGWCMVMRLGDYGLAGRGGQPRRARDRGRVGALAAAASTPRRSTATAEWIPQVWRDFDTTLAAAPLGDHAHRGDPRPSRRTRLPAVGGGPAGLPQRHRRDDPALSVSRRPAPDSGR